MTTIRTGRSPRWGFMAAHFVWVDQKLFIKRRQIIQTPWFAILLSRIYAPDDDRDPHDHSRWFCSLILSGGYTEYVFTDSSSLGKTRERTHRRWSAHVMKPERAHLITEVSSPLWTLVIAGRHRGTWSFWTADGKVDWKEYR